MIKCYNICGPSVPTATFHIQRWTETEESRPKLFYLFFIQWKKNHASLSCTSILLFPRIDSHKGLTMSIIIYSSRIYLFIIKLFLNLLLYYSKYKYMINEREFLIKRIIDIIGRWRVQNKHFMFWRLAHCAYLWWVKRNLQTGIMNVLNILHQF